MNSRQKPVAVLRYAVIGHPVAHSLSPQIHREFARQCDRTLEYVTLDATPDAFARTVQAFFDSGGAGLNVTLPHKTAAFALADEHGAAARRGGVANVLTPTAAGGLRADNTDGIGLLRDLRTRHGVHLTGAHVLLLGAGGAAHGVASSLLDAGIGRLSIANRTRQRAAALGTRLAAPDRIEVTEWAALTSIADVDIVLNSTAAGIHNEALNLPASMLGPSTVCYDLSYGPAATRFLGWAQQAGAKHAMDGLGMLVETAAASFAIWHGIQPDTEPVYRALNQETR